MTRNLLIAALLLGTGINFSLQGQAWVGGWICGLSAAMISQHLIDWWIR